MHYMQCAVSQFGTSFLETTCGYMVDEYTNQTYNGSDNFTYYVIEDKGEATGNGNPFHNPCNTLTCLHTFRSTPFVSRSYCL
jgi:hypothetical protein